MPWISGLSQRQQRESCWNFEVEATRTAGSLLTYLFLGLFYNFLLPWRLIFIILKFSVVIEDFSCRNLKLTDRHYLVLKVRMLELYLYAPIRFHDAVLKHSENFSRYIRSYSKAWLQRQVQIVRCWDLAHLFWTVSLRFLIKYTADI
jgi:hypothetical protein